MPFTELALIWVAIALLVALLVGAMIRKADDDEGTG